MGLVLTDAPQEPVWRVGYRPDPLAWSGWEHATDGRFHGRWDDPDGTFRTLYLGESLLACLLEVLAFARKDKHLAAALVEIDEDPEDAREHPTADPGTLDPAWLGPRCRRRLNTDPVASGGFNGGFNRWVQRVL